ncbi:hypothetical protein QQS21_004132 [Conoideocrella luteorostrata]|uniref:Heat-labile enterotoxin IIA, A chain n=1 Tax=Conoideocrella luteorostrata TaxID=1105319 RepID=A0AAJ0CRW6_9HYPO|nr:hypothetical protein QQS21_004132 [Conoideocrella luteorostrata]
MKPRHCKLLVLFVWRGIATRTAANVGSDGALIDNPNLKTIPDDADQANFDSAAGSILKRALPTDPSTVYRVSILPPATVKESAGFPPRQVDLSDAQFSIYEHAHASLTAGKSPYVSTSLRPQGAEIFASPGRTSYLYEIHATPNFIDTFTTLGGNKMTSDGKPYLLHKAEREFLAAGGIKWDQIVSWTALPNGRDTNRKDRKLELNKDYNKEYDKFKAGGPQYELAGFPDTHEAWKNEPWSQYKGADIKENGLKFVDKNGKAVALNRNTPIQFVNKHNTGQSTHSKPPSTGMSGKQPKGKTSSRFRVGSKAASAIGFQILAPYLHELLDKLKAWDHPVGHAVKWFDDSMRDIQEAIGGKTVPETGTNELHLKLLCFFKGLGDEPRHPDEIDRACQRQKKNGQGQTEQQIEEKRVEGLNWILGVCEKAETESTADNDRLDSVLKRCQDLRDKSSELENKNCTLKAGSQGEFYLTLHDMTTDVAYW